MLKRILKERRGEGYIDVAVGTVCIMLVIAFAVNLFPVFVVKQRLDTFANELVRQAEITGSTCNYDELYNGLREGYSGGYTLSNGQWKETLDYGDVYAQLDSLLGLETKNGYHIKTQDSGYEYRLSGLNINLQNTPLSPGNTSKNFEAELVSCRRTDLLSRIYRPFPCTACYGKGYRCGNSRGYRAPHYSAR